MLVCGGASHSYTPRLTLEATVCCAHQQAFPLDGCLDKLVSTKDKVITAANPGGAFKRRMIAQFPPAWNPGMRQPLRTACDLARDGQVKTQKLLLHSTLEPARVLLRKRDNGRTVTLRHRTSAYKGRSSTLADWESSRHSTRNELRTVAPP